MTIFRALLYRPITDVHGELVPDITVRFYEPGTTTQISDPVYDGPSGNTELELPAYFGDGIVVAYLARPRRVRLGIQPGGQSEFYLEDMEFLPAGDNGVLSPEVLVITNTPSAGQVLYANANGTASWRDVDFISANGNAGSSGGY